MFGFLYQLPQNLIKCFNKKVIFWHLLAIVITFLIIISGFDWYFFIHTRNLTLQAILFPAAIIGGLVPILSPFIILIIGKIKKNQKIINTGYAIGQSAFVGLLLSWFYKAFTGRAHPEGFRAITTSLVDNSHIFNFGFLRGGVFWGWPSSHTTVAFAISMALFTLYPKNKWFRVVVILYALYIGVGVSTNIHWFSDFVAGIIFGTIAGITVGKSFLNKKY